MYLVSGWSSSNFGASLQVLKPNKTHITKSSRNIISIKHTEVLFLLLFWLLLLFREGIILYGSVKNFYIITKSMRSGNGPLHISEISATLTCIEQCIQKQLEPL